MVTLFFSPRKEGSILKDKVSVLLGRCIGLSKNVKTGMAPSIC